MHVHAHSTTPQEPIRCECPYCHNVFSFRVKTGHMAGQRIRLTCPHCENKVGAVIPHVFQERKPSDVLDEMLRSVMSDFPHFVH